MSVTEAENPSVDDLSIGGIRVDAHSTAVPRYRRGGKRRVGTGAYEGPRHSPPDPSDSSVYREHKIKIANGLLPIRNNCLAARFSAIVR